MTERFSKKTLTEYIQGRLDRIQTHWGFDPRNGTSQIRGIGQSRKQTNPLVSGGYEDHIYDAAGAYGEFRSLLDMATRFELDVREIPSGYVPRKIVGGLTRYCPTDPARWRV